MKGKYPKMMREAELCPYPQVDFLTRRGRDVAWKNSHLILIVVFALAALGGLSAVVPDASVTVLAAQPVSGIYDLSFFADTLSGLVPLTNNSLPVGEELVLKAHVEDGSGHPAKRGSVIFQDCSLKGEPAPSAACVSGSGAWSHIITLGVDQFGNASVDFGFVSNPRTIGFRFKYIGQGSGIPNGASAPGDVTWF
jgi:hypothetical protein